LDEEICPDCVSGAKDCVEAEPKCGIQGECQGITIEHEGMDLTLDDCLNLCKNTSGSGWFTFYNEISQCILFESCSLTFCENCTSGEARCISWFPTEGTGN